jgi:hypothetical protein
MPTVDVNRSDITQTRVVQDAPTELQPGQSRLRVDAFGLTANNITYAVFGDMLQYWTVFPATDSPAEWGRVPAWGFAEVTDSRSEYLAVGERLYGFVPMSDEFVMTPGKSDASGVSDVAAHREGLFGTYNRYQRVTTDPNYRVDREQHQMLLYPLFVTGFVIDDFLEDQGDFGAEQVVVSSASAKTALGVAHSLRARGAKVVGLTSAGNVATVDGLGLYDEVLAYDQVDRLATVPSVFVDIAGNADVVHAVHTHLHGHLGHSMIVGNTNWDHQAATTGDLPAPAPEFFFAPTQIAKRTKEWGADGLAERMAVAWDRFADWSDGWLVFEHVVGADAVVAAFDNLAGGHTDPRTGFIATLLNPERSA